MLLVYKRAVSDGPAVKCIEHLAQESAAVPGSATELSRCPDGEITNEQSHLKTCMSRRQVIIGCSNEIIPGNVHQECQTSLRVMHQQTLINAG